MPDFTSRTGRHVSRRLRRDKIVWLTTVGSRGVPQPRPVWFHWNGRTVLIFSETRAAKLRHIARNSSVALNFNTDEDGGDVAVVIGTAVVSKARPPETRVATYLRKYRQGIKDIEMTVPQFKAAFSVPIIVTPRSIRGM